MFVEDCKIISKHYISKNQFILELESETISKNAKPGQFVNLSCGQLLRRPISVYDTNKNKNTFFIGIRIKGEGTAYLEKLIPGDKVNVLGPLGHGFDIANTKSVIVVGGGIGIFPLMFLLKEAKRKGIKTISVCGFKSKADSFLLKEFKQLSDQVIFSSECGDLDFCGNAYEALKTIDVSESAIYTCGPTIMMKSIAEYANENSIPCQVSLEERMGCGTGVCLVCACKIKTKNNKESNEDYEYKRCCKEGPVFDGSEVIWD